MKIEYKKLKEQVEKDGYKLIDYSLEAKNNTNLDIIINVLIKDSNGRKNQLTYLYDNKKDKFIKF